MANPPASKASDLPASKAGYPLASNELQTRRPLRLLDPPVQGWQTRRPLRLANPPASKHASDPPASKAGHPLASLLPGGAGELVEAGPHQVVQAVPECGLSCLGPGTKKGIVSYVSSSFSNLTGGGIEQVLLVEKLQANMFESQSSGVSPFHT